MIKQFNKKRKKATRLSLIVILIVILLAAISTLLSKIHFLFTILSILLLVTLLYLFSKFLIIPKYDEIKCDIIKYSIKNSNYVNCKRIKSSVTVFNIFFNVNDLSYINPFRFYNDKFSLDVEDFVITKKRKKNVVNKEFQGKIIKIQINNYFSKEVLAIMDNNQDTKHFVNIANEHFKNATLSSRMTPNGKYLTNTNNKDDLRKIGLLFSNIDGFNMILYKNNVLSIMIKQKEQPFEFNLQNEIDLNTIELAKKCYLDVDKIISNMKGEFKDE